MLGLRLGLSGECRISRLSGGFFCWIAIFAGLCNGIFVRLLCSYLICTLREIFSFGGRRREDDCISVDSVAERIALVDDIGDQK